jgi:dipeptidyl-peptidase 4
MLIKNMTLFILFYFNFQLYAQKLTLEEIFLSDKFKGKTINNIQWKPDGTSFTFTKNNEETNLADIYEHSISAGEEKLLAAGSDLVYNESPIKMSKYSWTDDGKYLLITGPETAIWRHSKQAPYFLFEVNTQTLTPLADGNSALKNVKLSPDGQKVGYVKEHNIYVTDLETGEEKAITKDGTANILNGEFDWVYEEEFSIADAWRWSPDGKKIAFWRMDQTRVKEFYLIDESGIYNKVSSLKYPKTGEQNSIVQIGIADIESETISWMDIGSGDDFYIPRIFWTNSSDILAILKLNRHQNYVELLFADSESGNSKVIIEDKNSTWVDVKQDIMFLKDSDQIIMTSERSNFNHAYLYDYSGNLINQITTGDWEISSLSGVDEKNRLLYFIGKKESPIEQHLYRINLSGKNLQNISQDTGWHEANYSPTIKNFIHFFSDVETPTKIALRNSDGSLVRMLEENKIENVEDYNLIFPEFIKVYTSDGSVLNAYIMKPENYEEDKKYPVIVFGYGGPGSQTVVNRWGSGSQSYHVQQRLLWHNHMLQQGYIIFCVDNRGTGGRGKLFKNFAYGDISKWAVNDHVEAAEYLSTLSYIDKNRIGFWGWSGGGYLALMLMTKGAPHFKAAVSVAPVSDFRLYDAIWTERYMGLLNENIEGYESASAFTYADKLVGNLLIIHGTTDDNVHYQNTLQMASSLQQYGKQFDLMIYPNKNHRIDGGSTQYHLFKKITEFFLEKL